MVLVNSNALYTEQIVRVRGSSRVWSKVDVHLGKIRYNGPIYTFKLAVFGPRPLCRDCIFDIMVTKDFCSSDITISRRTVWGRIPSRLIHWFMRRTTQLLSMFSVFWSFSHITIVDRANTPWVVHTQILFGIRWSYQVVAWHGTMVHPLWVLGIWISVHKYTKVSPAMILTCCVILAAHLLRMKMCTVNKRAFHNRILFGTK